MKLKNNNINNINNNSVVYLDNLIIYYKYY